MNSTGTSLCQNINPGIYHWIGAGSGVRGVSYNFVITKPYCQAELYIYRGEKSENKFAFDKLHNSKGSIEQTFGEPLGPESLDEKRRCRIKAKSDSIKVKYRHHKCFGVRASLLGIPVTLSNDALTMDIFIEGLDTYE